ncbi:hypothetical protein ACQP1G_01085 [Nocardia sp. CA-107356]|uniref:hypothetical protein n=1 Tax=Nocardia sp. CA-107356 TaxID=3239972 RepID=UPI003D89DD00
MGYPYGQPGYGYPQPAYGYQRPPSGGTAITAAIFGLIVGLLGAVGVVIGLIATVNANNKAHDYSRFGPTAPEVPGYVYGLVALGAVVALLWLLGAILLFRRSSAGRVILIMLSSLSLIGSVVNVATGRTEIGVLGVIPLTILICACVSSTGRWIAAGRTPYPYGQPVQPYAAPYGQPAQPSAAPYGQPAPFGQAYGQPVPDLYQQPGFQPGQYPQQPPVGQPPYPYQ